MPAIAAIFRSQLVSGLKGNGPAQRASLRMIGAIEADFAAEKAEFLKVVIEYKADAEREIGRRRKLGITDISDIDPHELSERKRCVPPRVMVQPPWAPQGGVATADALACS